MIVYPAMVINENGDFNIRIYEREQDAVEYLVKKRGMIYEWSDITQTGKRYFKCTNPLKKYRIGCICAQKVIEHV